MIFTDVTARAAEKAQKAVDHCRASMSSDTNNDPLAAIDALADCMAQQIDEQLAWEEDERSFQSKLRRRMAAQIPSYACGDVDFNTTEEMWNSTWSYTRRKGQKQKSHVKTYHERPMSSKIISISDFVVTKECEALRKLTTTTGDDENDNSDNIVPFDVVNGNTKEAWTTHALAARMYAFAEDQMKWESLEFQEQYNLGQELFEIYHDKDGVDLPVGPKCGKKEEEAATVSIDSDGQQVVAESSESESGENNNNKSCRVPGARPEAVPTRRFVASDRQVASFFIFCDEPSSLGGIHFPYAGVHINPKKGTAVLAVHRYPDDEDGDDDFEFDGYAQEYHLCPNHHVYVHTLLEEEM
jgi:hypothetical protein